MDGAEQQQHEGAVPASAASNGDYTITAAERRRRWRGAWWAIGIACLLGLAVIGAKWVWFQELRNREQRAKQNLYALQLQIERYTLENEEFPPPQVDLNWFRALSGKTGHKLDYVNPFTGKPAELVSFSNRAPGQITYIYIPAGTYDGEITRGGYFLLTYSPDIRQGRDISGDGVPDGVLHVVDSQVHYPAYSPQTIPKSLYTVWKAIQWAEGTEE